MAHTQLADSWLAIDYGTSNTVAMLSWPDGRVRPLLFDGSPLLPSAVCIGDDGRVLIGRAAQRHARLAPEAYEPHPKRRVDDLTLLLGERSVPVVELVAATLTRVCQEATRALSVPPVRTVITCPVEWGPARRSVLSDAAGLAGLPDVTLLAEPTGAATYFAAILGRQLPPGGCVVVYDLGAGTFDVSVVRRGDAGFEPLSYRGLDDFGGLDLDEIVLSIVGETIATTAPEEWQRLRNPQTVGDSRAFRTLWQDATEVKEALSTQSSAAMLVPLVDRDVIVSREQFEERIRPRLADTVRITMQCIRQARVDPQQIGGVFLVGGGTRIPLVATMLHAAVGVAPTVLDQPELIVAEGALQAIALAAQPGGGVTVAGAPGGALGAPPAQVPSSTPSGPEAGFGPAEHTAAETAPVPGTAPVSPVAGFTAPAGPFPPETPSSPYPSSTAVTTAVSVSSAGAAVLAPMSDASAPPEPAVGHPPRRPAEFLTATARIVTSAAALAMVGIGLFIGGAVMAADSVHLTSWGGYAGGGEAAGGLLALSLPGCLLVVLACFMIGALFSRTQLHIDEAGIRLKGRDPIIEERWRVAGLLVPSIALLAASLTFVNYWFQGDTGWWLAVVGVVSVAGIVRAVVLLRRTPAKRVTWLTLWRRSPKSGDPGAVIEVDTYSWPELRQVAVQRVGFARLRALVVAATDKDTIQGRPAVHRRLMFNDSTFIVVNLDAAGIAAAPVIAALHDHAGGRLARTVG